MVSWSRAFFLALKALIYAILWYIIGGILIFSGAWLAGLTIPLTPGMTTPRISYGVMSIIGIILVLIGAITMMFGALASVIKVIADEVVSQRRSYQPPPPPY